MLKMEWDKELEEFSQAYADTCPGMVHNPDPKTASYSRVGENIFWSSGRPLDVDFAT